jgi:Kef-type K+ transport system membrane component KefB
MHTLPESDVFKAITDLGIFFLMLMVALGFSVLSETLQMHFILGAFVVGLSKTQSLIIGIGMSGRGAVELIIADRMAIEEES